MHEVIAHVSACINLIVTERVTGGQLTSMKVSKLEALIHLFCEVPRKKLEEVAESVQEL